MFIVGMTLAPRKKETYNETIRSFRKAWFKEKLHIFAEPWKYQIFDKNIEFIENKTTLWCFKNYDFMLNQLIKKNGDHIITLQDDWIFNKNTRDIILNKIEDDYWFINLMTNHRIKDNLYKEWRNELNSWRYEKWNSLNNCWSWFLMKKNNVKKLISHDFYKNHYLNWINKRSDVTTAEVFRRLWLKRLYHNPSLVAHTWKESTIGHWCDYAIDLWFTYKKIC